MVCKYSRNVLAKCTDNQYGEDDVACIQGNRTQCFKAFNQSGAVEVQNRNNHCNGNNADPVVQSQRLFYDITGCRCHNSNDNNHKQQINDIEYNPQGTADGLHKCFEIVCLCQSNQLIGQCRDDRKS